MCVLGFFAIIIIIPGRNAVSAVCHALFLPRLLSPPPFLLLPRFGCHLLVLVVWCVCDACGVRGAMALLPQGMPPFLG